MSDGIATPNWPLLVKLCKMKMDIRHAKHGNSWTTVGPKQLMKRLRLECTELDEAVASGDPAQVIQEAVDVICQAAMIGSIVGDKK